MCLKKSYLLFVLLFVSLFFSQHLHSSGLLSAGQEQPEITDEQSAGQEILDVAEEILNLADRWDEYQKYLNQLTEELQESRTDSLEWSSTLGKMQETYEGLRKDYGLLQLELKTWKGISLTLGIVSGVSLLATILVSVLK